MVFNTAQKYVLAASCASRARGVKVIGATAHFVSADLDEGPTIEQIVEHVDYRFTPQMLTAVGRDSERRALATAVQTVPRVAGFPKRSSDCGFYVKTRVRCSPTNLPCSKSPA
jgi:formyltetrahydrofolate hydrolase